MDDFGIHPIDHLKMVADEIGKERDRILAEVEERAAHYESQMEAAGYADFIKNEWAAGGMRDLRDWLKGEGDV